ncbi:MAG: RluA family pseudouridine synthase [Treponema sp.]|jgi:23S rRNA pseudouridine955/2504/2580 synthase|nr:RluA family pseudouridine synthase [Treponema sp.]
MKDIPILFEDSNLLILNKPAGLAVQGGAGVGVSLESLLTEKSKKRPFLVHRLDKATSGVIVTAKTKESAALCSALFVNHQGALKKTYLAICAGILDEKGLIDEALNYKGRKLNAQTSFKRLRQNSLAGIGGISLAELEPATGRTHQIRRHLAQAQHPVLGDDKYGDFALNKKLKKMLGLKQLLLHAASIYLPPSLIGGEDGGGLLIKAPLPDYFLGFMEGLGK